MEPKYSLSRWLWARSKRAFYWGVLLPTSLVVVCWLFSGATNSTLMAVGITAGLAGFVLGMLGYPSFCHRVFILLSGISRSITATLSLGYIAASILVGWGAALPNGPGIVVW